MDLSFADKVNIKFDSGVMVVGPNGSGKVILQMLFVGTSEQSARVMRGAKMEDIIFDGTDNCSPWVVFAV